MTWILYIISGLLSGAIGAMGIGGGGILIIYLTLFAQIDQTRAQGINLLFFIPIAITAVFIYSRKHLIEWRIALALSLLGACGATVGFWIATFTDNFLLAKIFGAMLIILGIKGLFADKKNNKIIEGEKYKNSR